MAIPTAASNSRPRLSWGGAESKRKVVGRMGPWQLVRLLGEGALTRVYLARPLDTPEAVPAYAVKALRREWWNDASAIATLRREAHVGGSVSHPHVATVLSSQLAQPPFFLVSPRLPGETLAEKLAAGRRPSLPQALWIARQAAEALAALHTATGMIHGDVKPANLMVSPAGHATLIDLGACQTPREARAWPDRPVVGTLHYIAPEMVTSTYGGDRRSDLYSLGVTLYEMLAGARPFDAEDPAELITLHREAKPRCLRDARPDAPKPVASLVHRLLAKDPMRRPATPEEVAEALVRLEIASFAVR
ncbi:MAG: serine/threonine-protein kinase [Planctomycetota bacterium]